MPKLTINGTAHEFTPGMTVLQVCEQAGVEIPRFCYHERLSIAGNCRMCLVEVKPGPPKLQASCALPAGDGQEITTDSEQVRKARKGVMEFLLINHPLDCPICDQGGECDLQDQAMAYGFDGSRYDENKRAVADKYMGPLINTIMTRCIHCTRCVRFVSEVAGVDGIGLLNRGEGAEISSLEQAIDSELSANVIDLCPVGALTSRPYAFEARPWELQKTESVDVLDAVGAAIRIDSRGNEVMRILPRLNEDVNGEWISDKTRFACDGLRRQRLDRPYLRDDNGRLQQVGWDQALAHAAATMRALKGKQMAAIAGDQADVEALYALKRLFADLGSPHLDCRQDGAAIGDGPRASYLFNSTIAGIEEADALLIIGSHIRHEAPLINAAIRRRWLGGGLRIAAIGDLPPTTYDVERLGDGPEELAQLAGGKHPFCRILKKAKRPMLILGMGALARPDGGAVLAAARAVAETCNLRRDDWNGFNMLHLAAGRVGALDVGFLPGKGGADVAGILEGAEKDRIKLVYLLGADEIDHARLHNAFVIYQGHHGDAGAHAADLILPGAAYSEKSATFVNTEGRVQMTRRAVFPPGEAKEDWAIIRALSGELAKATEKPPLPFDSLEALRKVLRTDHPHLAVLDAVGEGAGAGAGAEAWGTFGADGPMDAEPFTTPVANFYMTCAVSRASPTMAECSRAFVLDQDGRRTGTDG